MGGVEVATAVIPAGDDLVHAAADDPIWRESYHFGFGNPGSGQFGYATFGKRPVKGRSGFLIAFWDPDQGFLVGQEIDTFDRHDDNHDVAGLRAACVAPFEEWRVAFEGSLVRTPRIGERRYEEARAVPPEQADRVPVSFDFTWRASAPVHAYTWQEQFRALFDGRHEQPGSCEGTIKIGGEEIEMGGWSGIRDHAWGARDWFGASGWRWISASFDGAPDISLLATRDEGGRWIVDGAIFDGESEERIVAYEETTEEHPAPGKPEPVAATFTITGARGRRLDVRGEVVAALPIRFQPRDAGAPQNWNDRCIARFESAGISGIGELEFGALVPRKEDDGDGAPR
jgi:hypothetical protein